MPELEDILNKSIPFLKKWGGALILIPFMWVSAEQFWMALKWEISFSYRYTYPFFLSPFYFMTDNFLLIIHEAGHTFFRVFGSRFMIILGGTFLEIFLPFVIFFYGWWNRRTFVAQLGMLLTGFAWMDSSAYAADAMFRRLPLIGGLGTSAHDFGNMLRDLNILDSYMTVAWTFYAIGIISYLLVIVMPFMERKSYKTSNIELKL
ncbi:hypothetical protein AB2B38_000755 [Balneola sp. MJW-20]|uniref:hypothetical protein n=1 Tax=Gracilimonas aurantiaca TaxID=3234185 RepID=UPI0034664CDF